MTRTEVGRPWWDIEERINAAAAAVTKRLKDPNTGGIRDEITKELLVSLGRVVCLHSRLKKKLEELEGEIAQLRL